MNEQCKKMLITVAIASFGIPTGLINGIIAWFTVKAPVDIHTMFVEMLIGGFFCGLIIPFFGPVVLMSHLKKHPNLSIGIRREQHMVSRFVPLNLFAGALVIAIMVTILFAVIPFGAGVLLGVPIIAQPMTWIIFKGCYSVLIAATAGYFGALNVLYSYATKGRVSVGA